MRKTLLTLILLLSPLAVTAQIVDWVALTQNAAFSPRHSGGLVNYHISGSPDYYYLIAGHTSTGFSKEVWRTVNGVDWTAATRNAKWEFRERLTSLVYNNKMWVIAGGNAGGEEYLADVWYSTNGADWYAATKNAEFGRIEAHTSVVYDNKMWVFGGWNGGVPNNDVWYSTDGASWTQVNQIDWGARERHASIVFDNKMWIIGGNATIGTGDGVWSSTDGAQWQNPTLSAAFDERYGHTAFVWDNKMWVAGGFTSDGVTDSVYSSEEGATWVYAGKLPSPRAYAHSVTTTSGAVMLIGGIDAEGGTQYNDVWVPLLASNTPTYTSTKTATPTITPTNSPVLSVTPTITMTSTMTVTPESTFTVTQTVTQTNTPEATSTVTQTITPVLESPEIRLMSNSKCDFHDAIKISISWYSPDSGYVIRLYLNGTYRELTSVDNLAQIGDKRFIYAIRNLEINQVYEVYAEVESQDWGVFTTNTIYVQLYATPTPTPTETPTP